MGGAEPGADADAGAPPYRAAVLWGAAGAAMEWKALILDHAARARSRKAWAIKARAGAPLRRAAAACGRAVDANGRMDPDAMGRAVGELRRAGRLTARASRSFGRSSGLYEAAGAEQDRASKAFERSADPEHAAFVRDMAVGSHRRSAEAAKAAAGAIAGARDLWKNAAGLADGTIRRLREGGAWKGDRRALSSIRAGMLEDARRARTEAAAMIRLLSETELLAIKVRRLAAATARLPAEAAASAAASKGGGQDDPAVQEAEAAWRRAVAEADRAEAEHPDE